MVKTKAETFVSRFKPYAGRASVRTPLTDLVATL